MSGTGNAPYTIGRNLTLIVLWNGLTVQMDDVTRFSAAQEVKQQRSDPLNSTPVEFNTPSGWRGAIGVDRKTAVIDGLFAAIESAFWANATINTGTIYQYITEIDGSQSCFEFSGVSLTLTNAGDFQSEEIVRQTMGFFASQRVRLA